MSQYGATLQTYNNELVMYIEKLTMKRKDLQVQILQMEESKAKLQNEIRSLNERLTQINQHLENRLEIRDQYDRLIMETEQAYSKILQSSQALLTVLKTETTNLTQKDKTFGMDVKEDQNC